MAKPKQSSYLSSTNQAVGQYLMDSNQFNTTITTSPYVITSTGGNTITYNAANLLTNS